MDNKRKSFLIYELQILTINAAVQHNKIYANECSDSEKKSFRNKLRDKLNILSERYKNDFVLSEDHINNIREIINFSQEIGATILNNNKLTFGTAQKLLNLYLKYLWCADMIKMPPHCPFDRIILEQLGIKDSWTKSDSQENYLKWVSIAKLKAGSKSIAEWELETFNRR